MNGGWRHHRGEIRRVGRHGISHVTRGLMSACHIPAAPSQLEGAAMVGGVGRSVHRDAIDTGVHAADEWTRYVLRGVRGVARDARVVALELRHAALRLLEGVEDGALLWILSDHLEHRSSSHPADRHRVVEKDRARVLRVDSRRLEARLREHQYLRLDRDV